MLKIRGSNGVAHFPFIRGKSAYEYAVGGGYTGSEEEYSKLMAYDAEKAVNELNNNIIDLETSKVTQTDLENEVADRIDGMKVDIVQEILVQIKDETSSASNSVFGKVNDDGKIVITTDLNVGTYILGFEDDNGTFTEVGSITIVGEATVFSIARTLTGCTSNKTDTSVLNGDSYNETITLNRSHVLSKVVIIMGGVDITDSAYNNGKIAIDSVTGDVVITVTAIAVPDLVPSAVDLDGEIVDGVGYRRGYRLTTSDSTTIFKASDGAAFTTVGLMSVTNGVAHDIYVYGLDFTGTTHNKIAVYNYSNGTFSSIASVSNLEDGTVFDFITAATKLADNYFKFTTTAFSSKIKYFAVSGVTVDGIVPIVTVDQPIF